MNKENYGIPATLLCIAIYLVGLYGAVNTQIWPMLTVTIAVFALSFNSEVKKTAVQALGIVLICAASYMVLKFFGNLNTTFTSSVDFDSDSISSYLSSRGKNGFSKFLDIVEEIVNYATYVIFFVLLIARVINNGIIINKVHMVVDGVVPVKPVSTAPQQMYQQQPQQMDAQAFQATQAQQMYQQYQQQVVNEQPQQNAQNQQRSNMMK